MGFDQYKVDVLHFINPHLIWALVHKGRDVDEFHFEQIGIYGILPQNVTFGGLDCVLKVERCEEWMPAASVAMKKCFLQAAEVWFSPTYVDTKTTVFDANSHIYGDIIVIKKNGEKVNLLQEIVNSDFAYKDEHQFQQELTRNNLKTQLNHVTMHEVMKTIEEAYATRDIPKETWLSAIMKHQPAPQKHIQPSASRHEASDHDNVATLLKNKLNVLKVCQDVDKVSLGRACTRTSLTSGRSSIASLALKKKLEWLESQSLANQPKASETGVPVMHADDKTNADMNKKTDGEDEQDNIRMSPENRVPAGGRNYNIAKGKKPRKPVNNSNQTLVAYGPAGLQANKFAIKPWTPKVEKEEPVVEERKPEPKPEQEFEVKKSQDVYASTDSEVNLKISNLELLKRIKFLSSKHNNTVTNKLEVKNNVTNKMEAKNENLNSLKGRIKYLEEKMSKINDSVSSTSDKDSSKCDIDSDEESITELEEKLGLRRIKKNVNVEPQTDDFDKGVKRYNVNPFRNLDGSISVFVDKLVSPILMVHTKKNNRIEPVSNMRDIPFGHDIHVVLRNMGVKKPMRPQTVSWPTILRGHSFFLVGPYNSGNTMGYLPAVCRLVYDFKNSPNMFGLSCIIVCATSHSVASVENQCKMFLHNAKIFACYAGMSDLHITTSLLNGCDLLICTPSMLVRLIQEDFSLDLRSLSTFVVDDCEHISSTYPKELKFCLLKVRDVVKNRAHKEWKVQYVVISRIWCDFMSSLARKAPDSVICISAFEECVLYSKAATSVEFVAQENKLTTVINFLEGIDKSKKTVIVCRSDDEVKLLEKTLVKLNYVVFPCDSTMNVQELYNLDKTWKDYQEPVLGPILVCCDGNLTHLNVTDASYLIHYSLPDLFSMFCKRFAALIDNYPSIYKGEETDIKIKILLDSNNIQQLPKILHFIKRCTQDVPPFLDEISSRVLNEKFLKKAQNLVPICRRLLTLGKCPDFWNCVERHAIFKEFDSPKPWMPREGVISFKILHYHSAVNYSARLLSCINKNKVSKYQQTYSLLSIKMGMYYSKEVNRRLHGAPKVGDVCSVTLKQNLFVRCQVAKVLEYEKNRATLLLIKLIDEERYETAHDTSLYYLPDELKNIETHVVNVILANLMPQDKDVTFSKLAENQLKHITDENEDLEMRGKIIMVVGNTIFVDTLEACQNLTSLDEIVVKSDFRRELLDGHAISNPDHISNLRKVCDFNYEDDIPKEKEEPVKVASPKQLPKGRWAHLESGEFSPVFFIQADNPCKFFVRPVKFDKCLNSLIKDIQKHVSENPKPIENITVGDIVLAEFPDDATIERARIDSDVKNDKVKCFFVDQGEWRDVIIKKLYPITAKFITQMPFQAIECRLVGVKPFGNNWTDFSTNFFADACFDSLDKHKQLFTKYFTKEKAECTEGHKYGVVLIDTYSAKDVIINKILVQRGLAKKNDEIKLLKNLGFERKSEDSSDSDIDEEPDQPVSKIDRSLLVNNTNKQIQYIPNNMSNNLLRSVPLVDSDSSMDDFEFITDDAGQLGAVPISQVVSIKELPDDTVWTDKVLASPVSSYVAPSSVTSSSSSSVRPADLSSSTDSLVRPSDVALSSDNFVRPTGEVSPTNSFVLPSGLASPADSLVRASDVALSSDNFVRPTGEVSPTNNCVHPSGLASPTDSLVRASDVALSSDNFVRPTGVVSPTNSFVIPSGLASPTDSLVRASDVALSSDNFVRPTGEVSPTNNLVHLSAVVSSTKRPTDVLSKPRLLWRQNKQSVTIDIKLIVDDYDLIIKDRYIKFSAESNDTNYGFDFELYGVVDLNKCSHSNKGQYIQVKLWKVMARNWLTLTRHNEMKRWILYDVESMCVSSDEESEVYDYRKNIITYHADSDTDDDLLDDTVDYK
ncbi:hypothetical protein PYW08_011184 [Mythimna loreyi]|uniref:Uncharacterized protein n=1 Tax=Mythimna loreyi TaxID=667449 RepID=A0ACC2Q667_9NEOP|nr:hypothetical protein PYW08_011184 [Mythimna loreyi]